MSPSDFDLVCHFDGGYNNVKKANGYGSFRIFDNSTKNTFLRTVQFPLVNSSNEAEYETLITLLIHLLNTVKADTNILIRGDSKLVINQVTGEWKVNAENLIDKNTLGILLMRKLEEVANVGIEWVARENIVRVLGH